MTITRQALHSTTHQVVDDFEANELFQRNGWTDGLPIVAPTEDRVRQCLDENGLPPDQVIGTEPVRRREITAEKVAINAVMAGCLPSFMPVILAALRAMCSEEFCLHGSTASTGGSAQLIIVNGPIRNAIGMNATHNLFGNGNRANATIGRAVRLVLINVLGSVPGVLDRSTLGHAGKYSFCVAEDEEDSPWLSLAGERGIRAGDSAVTVLAAEAPRQVMTEWSQNPEDVLQTFVAEIRANMLSYSIWPGNYVLVIPKQLREVIARAGWQKREIREYVFRNAVVRRKDWRAAGKEILVGRGDEEQEFHAFRSPDDVLVVAAGGPAGGFGVVIAPWVGNRSFAVTRRIP